MEIAFDFKARKLCVNLSNGQSFHVTLELLSMFLIANLFVTLTWLIPNGYKKQWIEDLQRHLDMAEETDFNNTNIVNHETKEKTN